MWMGRDFPDRQSLKLTAAFLFHLYNLSTYKKTPQHFSGRLSVFSHDSQSKKLQLGDSRLAELDLGKPRLSSCRQRDGRRDRYRPDTEQ